jgi:hypothetical protein
MTSEVRRCSCWLSNMPYGCLGGHDRQKFLSGESNVNKIPKIFRYAYHNLCTKWRESHLTVEVTVIDLNDKILIFFYYLKCSKCLPLTLTHCPSPSGTLARIVSQRRRNFLTNGFSVLISSVKWRLSHISC